MTSILEDQLSKIGSFPNKTKVTQALGMPYMVQCMPVPSVPNMGPTGVPIHSARRLVCRDRWVLEDENGEKAGNHDGPWLDGCLHGKKSQK